MDGLHPKETGWDDIDCVHLAQDTAKRHALVNMVMNLQPLYHVKTVMTYCTRGTVIFLR
jgi:hypothetical protein